MNILLYGLQVTAIGLIVVFFGLFLLIISIKLMGLALGKSPKKEPVKAAPVPAPAPIAAEPVIEDAQSDEGEIVAAIMAAISSIAASSGKQLVIRSIRKSQSGSWKNAYR